MSTEVADRFRTEVEVPDLPPSPGGRQHYWDDTIMEMVVELRRRLRSSNDERATNALMALVELEKTRMRHGQKVSGTHVPVLAPLIDEWGHPISSPVSAKVTTTTQDAAKSQPPAPPYIPTSSSKVDYTIAEFHDTDDDWKDEVLEIPEESDTETPEDQSIPQTKTKIVSPPQQSPILAGTRTSAPLSSGTTGHSPPHPRRIVS